MTPTEKRAQRQLVRVAIIHRQYSEAATHLAMAMNEADAFAKTGHYEALMYMHLFQREVCLDKARELLEEL